MKMNQLWHLLGSEPPVGPFCCIICMQNNGNHKMDCPLRGSVGASRNTWFQDLENDAVREE